MRTSITIHFRFSGRGIVCTAPASCPRPRTAFDRPDAGQCGRPRSPGRSSRVSDIPRTADARAGSGHGPRAIHGRSPCDGHFLLRTGRGALRSTPRPTGSGSRDGGRDARVFWAFSHLSTMRRLRLSFGRGRLLGKEGLHAELCNRGSHPRPAREATVDPARSGAATERERQDHLQVGDGSFP